MKHLFYIHSYVTFLASIKVIKYLKLKHEDCVFVIHRGKVDDYQCPGIRMVRFGYERYDIETYTLRYKFWKNWKSINKLDKFVDDAVENSNFIFYTPQTFQSFLSLIVTHRRCKAYHIIEEGLGSYLK